MTVLIFNNKTTLVVDHYMDDILNQLDKEKKEGQYSGFLYLEDRDGDTIAVNMDQVCKLKEISDD